MCAVTRKNTTILIALLIVLSTRAQAAPTAEEQCNAARYKAAAKYASCQLKAQAKIGPAGNFGLFEERTRKCNEKYAEKWVVIQTLYPTTSCAAPRLVDNGNGTITDNMTGLMWEKKTDDATVHDWDNLYELSTNDGDITDSDGSAFTAFLSALNSSCFAGHCDWRLPTRAELQSIQIEPCTSLSGPCIDPIFGLTQTDDRYWTSSTYQFEPNFAWQIGFGGAPQFQSKVDITYVRAVRGGQ